VRWGWEAGGAARRRRCRQPRAVVVAGGGGGRKEEEEANKGRRKETRTYLRSLPVHHGVAANARPLRMTMARYPWPAKIDGALCLKK
jgi:hypothetical protein